MLTPNSRPWLASMLIVVLGAVMGGSLILGSVASGQDPDPGTNPPQQPSSAKPVMKPEAKPSNSKPAGTVVGDESPAVRLLVPAYSNPANPAGQRFWDVLVAAARDKDARKYVHVIFNPASGPGTARDPNYLNGQDQGPLADFHAAGGHVYGYVATGYADRPLADVKSEIDIYLKGFYGGYCEGIFLDEMSSDLAKTSYYTRLRRYARSLGKGVVVIGNPGTDGIQNPTNQTRFTAANWVDSVDVIVSFENNASEYSWPLPIPPHLVNVDSARIGHILHSRPKWDDPLFKAMRKNGAGWVYVTDDVMTNPYDQIPGYWDAMLNRVKIGNR